VSAQLLDGKALSKTIREQLKGEFAAFTASHGMAPGLAVLRVGLSRCRNGRRRRAG
jgi:5,10-methylene-tetrahydrofolate dehydrogenase/methenyl tetrahydrofolate cyclohydrolase